jgi:hypothetical protein
MNLFRDGKAVVRRFKALVCSNTGLVRNNKAPNCSLNNLCLRGTSFARGFAQKLLLNALYELRPEGLSWNSHDRQVVDREPIKIN